MDAARLVVLDEPKPVATMPRISCICPTYGRVPYDTFMLEECVYWFTRQTYVDKELIILNDAPEQQLVCDVPQVVVINFPRRFASLGDKYNYLCSVATGDIIVPWEDDDISLPHRLSQIASKLQGSYEYWKPGGAFFQPGQLAPGGSNLSICSPGNVFHNACGYKKTLLRKLSYPSVSGPQDAIFDAKALQLARVNTVKTVVPSEYSYIYRWQHGSGKQPNLSGHTDTELAYSSRPKPVAGVYNILPVMYADYVSLTKGVVK